MIKWLLFCISSPLTWAPSLGAQTGILASERLWICYCWVFLDEYDDFGHLAAVFR